MARNGMIQAEKHNYLNECEDNQPSSPTGLENSGLFMTTTIESAGASATKATFISRRNYSHLISSRRAKIYLFNSSSKSAIYVRARTLA